MNESSFLIYDTGTPRCQLRESAPIGGKSNPTVLGTLSGVCSDFSQATRNKNLYSKKLWERILASDSVKEALDTHTLFGSLDHPENLENFASDAAVCCTKLWIDEPNECLMGTFDVLPTVKGKILDSLLKYGSILGVSSRGVGDLIPIGDDVQKVDEDNYLFVCFDVVTQPAAIKARQKYKALTESLTPGGKSLLDTLMESVVASKSEGDIDSISAIISKVGLADNETLKECLNNTRSNLKKTEKDTTIVVEGLRKDLEAAYSRIATLESNNTGNTAIMAELGVLRSQFGMTKAMIETFQTDQGSGDKKVIHELKKQGKDLISLMEALAALQGSLANSGSTAVKKLEESYAKDIARLEGLLAKREATIKQYGERNKELKESLDYCVGFVEKCKTAIAQRDTLLESLNVKNAQLTEALKTAGKPVTTVVPKVSLSEGALLNYIHQKEIEYAIDLSETIPDAKQCTTLKEVESLIKGYMSNSSRKGLTLKEAIDSSIIPDDTSTQREDSDLSVLRAAIRQRGKG